MLIEDRKSLSKKTLDLTRAIDSLTEELLAVELYQQRSDACSNPELKRILIHNMNEEKNHSAMLIEWIRQNDKEFSKEIKKFLNLKTKDIASKEK